MDDYLAECRARTEKAARRRNVARGDLIQKTAAFIAAADEADAADAEYEAAFSELLNAEREADLTAALAGHE